MLSTNRFSLKQDKWQLAKLGQTVEQKYVGLQCGIMDQFAVLFGKENHLLKLDCQSLKFEDISADIGEHQFLLCNSMVKHNLADSAYNTRKKECEEAVESLKVQGLRDITKGHLKYLNGKPLLRAKHIIEENERVHELSKVFENKDYSQVGKLLTKGHLSLKNQYEVTCEETDFLVEESNKINGVLGARQMGGGFGGCVLVLIHKSAVKNVITHVKYAYEKQFSITPEFYEVRITNCISKM